MRHLRLSYVILVACAALLVYGLVQGTSRTSALFVGEKEATGGVDASVAFPVSVTPTPPGEPTKGFTPTAAATEAAATQVADETSEPSATEAPGGTATAGSDTSQTGAAQTPTRVPRTTGPVTTTPTADACEGSAVLALSIVGSGGGPFEVEVEVANEGGGDAANVILGYSIVDGWEFADEGVFGDGQLWWPHGQPDTGVIVALGDVLAGESRQIFLALDAYPEAADGDAIVLRVSVVGGECLTGDPTEGEVTLIVGEGTPTPDETPETTLTPAVDTTKSATLTPALTTTPDVTETPELEETPGVTETAETTATHAATHAATNTAVPTSTSTPVPTSTATKTATSGGGGSAQTPVREVEGEQAVPASPTPTPRPLGQVLPDAGEGYSLPGGGSLDLYIGVALLVLCLGGAALAGRRM